MESKEKKKSVDNNIKKETKSLCSIEEKIECELGPNKHLVDVQQGTKSVQEKCSAGTSSSGKSRKRTFLDDMQKEMEACKRTNSLDQQTKAVQSIFSVDKGKEMKIIETTYSIDVQKIKETESNACSVDAQKQVSSTHSNSVQNKKESRPSAHSGGVQRKEKEGTSVYSADVQIKKEKGFHAVSANVQKIKEEEQNSAGVNKKNEMTAGQSAHFIDVWKENKAGPIVQFADVQKEKDEGISMHSVDLQNVLKEDASTYSDNTQKGKKESEVHSSIIYKKRGVETSTHYTDEKAEACKYALVGAQSKIIENDHSVDMINKTEQGSSFYSSYSPKYKSSFFSLIKAKRNKYDKSPSKMRSKDYKSLFKKRQKLDNSPLKKRSSINRNVFEEQNKNEVGPSSHSTDVKKEMKEVTSTYSVNVQKGKEKGQSTHSFDVQKEKGKAHYSDKKTETEQLKCALIDVQNKIVQDAHSVELINDTEQRTSFYSGYSPRYKSSLFSLKKEEKGKYDKSPSNRRSKYYKSPFKNRQKSEDSPFIKIMKSDKNMEVQNKNEVEPSPHSSNTVRKKEAMPSVHSVDVQNEKKAGTSACSFSEKTDTEAPKCTSLIDVQREIIKDAHSVDLLNETKQGSNFYSAHSEKTIHEHSFSSSKKEKKKSKHDKSPSKKRSKGDKSPSKKRNRDYKSPLKKSHKHSKSSSRKSRKYDKSPFKKSSKSHSKHSISNDTCKNSPLRKNSIDDINDTLKDSCTADKSGSLTEYCAENKSGLYIKKSKTDGISPFKNIDKEVKICVRKKSNKEDKNSPIKKSSKCNSTSPFRKKHDRRNLLNKSDSDLKSKKSSKHDKNSPFKKSSKDDKSSPSKMRSLDNKYSPLRESMRENSSCVLKKTDKHNEKSPSKNISKVGSSSWVQKSRTDSESSFFTKSSTDVECSFLKKSSTEGENSFFNKNNMYDKSKSLFKSCIDDKSSSCRNESKAGGVTRTLFHNKNRFQNTSLDAQSESMKSTSFTHTENPGGENSLTHQPSSLNEIRTGQRFNSQDRNMEHQSGPAPNIRTHERSICYRSKVKEENTIQPDLSAKPSKFLFSTPAEEFYEKNKRDSKTVTATSTLKELHNKFRKELVERAERARALLPKYEPPPRKTKLRKPPDTVCSSSDTSEDSSSEEEDTSLEELEKKRKHPYRLHPELWFNDPKEMNDGPLCRCSAKASRAGIRHGIYMDEDPLPPCDPLTNNAHRLHHYRITMTPLTNFLTDSPTVIPHCGHQYVFEGFSLLSHYPIPKLPSCRVIRFNYEYTIMYTMEPMPPNFTVEGLDLFSRFLLSEVLELVDLDWRAHDDAYGCPHFHVFPRFAKVGKKSEKKELLSLNVILQFLLDSNTKLFDQTHVYTKEEWQKLAEDVKGMIVTCPGMKPSSLRVDQLDEENELPVIVHFGVRPPQLSYAGNPLYQKAWREYVKFRHLLANKPKVSYEDRHLLVKKEMKLQEMRMENDLKRDVTVVVPCQGFFKTGLTSDIVQHAMLLPVLVCHLRFHKSLKQLENGIGYKFKDRFLLQLALTHPSYRENFGTNPDHARNSLTNCGLRQPQYGDRRIHYMNTRKRGINTLINIMSRFGVDRECPSRINHNERLEFLGDAVVEFLSSIHLFYMFPDLEEGGLATYRAAIVQNQHLAVLSKKLHLEKFMLYAHGSDLCHDLELRHAMANCFEALMGALFLDNGIETADKVFSVTLFPEADLQEVWMNYPLHPLQEQEPEGDRKWIDSVPLLQKLCEFENLIGIEFTHIRLLARALTHRSLGYNNLTLGSNQRLEFLGDTVLQLVASEYLYKFFPHHHEGHLSLLRSSLVNNRTQAVVCRDLGMIQYAIYPEFKVELKPKDKADLLEAFLGALYVDKDLGYCRKFCEVCFFPRLQDFILNQDWNDPKSKLQQCCLTLRSMDGGEPDIPTYKVIECKGPTNTRVYSVAVYFQSKRLAVGSGHSIQHAEMDAASSALKKSKDLFPQLRHQKRAIERSLKQGKRLFGSPLNVRNNNKFRRTR